MLKISLYHPGTKKYKAFIPSTHWTGGWVDLRAGMDNIEK
jgi:hypothetical protein